MTFEEAIEKSKTIKERPSNEDLLKLYALFKQASEGDVSGERPGGFDFKGAAKYDAWAKIKGLNQQSSKGEYIKLVESLLQK